MGLAEQPLCVAVAEAYTLRHLFKGERVKIIQLYNPALGFGEM